ncbi:MAG: amidohydrolase, partial [Emcibacteraceae bacterium]|nr:amidohydrolase [Emcibacteraceae bacterium]
TTIYTANDDMPKVEAVASLGDKIVFVGSNADAAHYMCGDASVIDMAGNTVLPGLVDAHQHVAQIGSQEKMVDLYGLMSLRETVEKIKEYADTKEDGEWIIGGGWIETHWPEGRFINRHDVDAFTKNKPLYIPRSDGVSAFANTKGLEMMGIALDEEDPFGGSFERDQNGDITGYMIANAMTPFIEGAMKHDDDYVRDSMERGMRTNVRRGWTGAHDAMQLQQDIRVLKGLNAEGKLLHRVYGMGDLTQAFDIMADGRHFSENNMYTVRMLKMYLDGTLGSRGAALIENYEDADHNGLLVHQKDDLKSVMHEALRAGFQIGTHAIGDRANREILNWYEEAYNEIPVSERIETDPRWRIEHAQNIHPDDQQRFVDLGIMPSMQASHAIGDLHFAMNRLGAGRLEYAYPWRTMVDLGAMVLGGSDAPVEVGDPRIEFYAAITRKDTSGFSGEGWHLEQVLTREEALKMFTLWPAYGAFQEDILGSIKVGKLADFSIFNRDWMIVPEADILTSENLMTIVGGRVTYEKK